MELPVRLSFRTALAFLSAAFFLAPLLATSAEMTPLPVETDRGRFEGTWYRVEPGVKQAIQIRNENGRWELRFYWKTSKDFEVDTEWNERTEFTYQGFPGVLTIAIDQEKSTKDRIYARLERSQLGASGARLEESGDLEIYRAEIGRKLIWTSYPYQRRVSLAEPLTPDEADGITREEHYLLRFLKESERIVAWDEIHW